MNEATIRLVSELLLITVVVAVAVFFVVRRAMGQSMSGQDSALLRSQEELLARREALELEYREKQASFESEEDRQRAASAELEKLHEQASANARATEEALVRASRLSPDEARARVFENIEREFREEIATKLKLLEQTLTAEVTDRAKRLMLQVMERTNADYVTEATVAVVALPNEEMKGRLIGREGRNIRSFEQLTGVDLIIDETPEAVVISSFDPLRREVARLALMNLMLDGRIHPGRIEELVEKAQAEVELTVQESGEQAAERAGVTGLPAKVVEMMGRLRFRASLAQNVLDHSVEVSQLAAMLASELGYNPELARRAGFLHDIGKALPPEWDGPHALAGMEFLRQFEFRDSLLNAVGAHHREIEPASPVAEIVIIADSLSAARPGARRENLDNYVKRLAALEALANGVKGVERSFAVQAGRELRVIVVPDQIDDLQAANLAKELARRIEAELDHHGQVKVTVIRETRVQEIAK